MLMVMNFRADIADLMMLLSFYIYIVSLNTGALTLRAPSSTGIFLHI